MKYKILTLAALLSAALTLTAQSGTGKMWASVGGSIQHYNGNLGNSFFQFKTTCFAGVTGQVGYALNSSLELMGGLSAGHFGYCPTPEDQQRTVAVQLRCPGESCASFTGMGNLRSLLLSGNISIKYNWARGLFKSATPRLDPYVYIGLGMNRLIDVMKRDCVNEGNHFSLNSGGGLNYHITRSVFLGYNFDLLCFTSKKVYLTNNSNVESGSHTEDPLLHSMEKRKDLCLRNAVVVGFRF